MERSFRCGRNELGLDEAISVFYVHLIQELGLNGSRLNSAIRNLDQAAARIRVFARLMFPEAIEVNDAARQLFIGNAKVQLTCRRVSSRTVGHDIDQASADNLPPCKGVAPIQVLPTGLVDTTTFEQLQMLIVKEGKVDASLVDEEALLFNIDELVDQFAANALKMGMLDTQQPGEMELRTIEVLQAAKVLVGAHP